jgi:hypothetical protein
VHRRGTGHRNDRRTLTDWKFSGSRNGLTDMTDADSSLINGLAPGSPVVVYLHSPKEKLWGILKDLNGAGAYIRGMDLNSFDDWVRMIIRGERNIGLTHVFLPMWRVERISLDESVDDIPSLADRFYSQAGLTVHEYLDPS